MSMTSSSRSPCAACKFLRRKCLPECIFAPYFPQDQQQKFTSVHKVFGASNVSKLLSELHPNQREDAVNSLAYEADMRLRDPVYGCIGVISVLQHQLGQLQNDLTSAKSELSRYQNHPSDSLIYHRYQHQINFLGSGMTTDTEFQHQFFPIIHQQHEQHAASTSGHHANSYHAINMSGDGGLLSGHQQAQAAGTAADERQTPVEPS